ncbi:hypothetical protein HN51_024231 [Arachis hypogaea]
MHVDFEKNGSRLETRKGGRMSLRTNRLEIEKQHHRNCKFGGEEAETFMIVHLQRWNFIRSVDSRGDLTKSIIHNYTSLWISDLYSAGTVPERALVLQRP